MRILSDRNLALVVAILAALWLSMLMLGGPESTVDPAVLQAVRAPALVPAARWITRLGDWDLLLPISIAAALLVAWRGSLRSGAALMLMIAAGRVLVELQKAQFDRARPDTAGHLVAAHTMAFPSGHAAHSMTAFLGIVLVAVTAPRLRGPAILLALLLSATIGLSRLILAVHWPSDVIGGWAYGGAWALLLARLASGRDMPAPPRRD